MNKMTNLAVDPKEELAAWWQAYLAIYAALQLDDTLADTQRERTAVERADLAMRVWANKMRSLLNAETDVSLAEQIYLESKRKSESTSGAPATFVNGDHVPEKNPQ